MADIKTIQEMATQTVALGLAVLTRYRDGTLEDEELAEMCAKILNFEQAVPVASDSTSDDNDSLDISDVTLVITDDRGDDSENSVDIVENEVANLNGLGDVSDVTIDVSDGSIDALDDSIEAIPVKDSEATKNSDDIVNVSVAPADQPSSDLIEPSDADSGHQEVVRQQPVSAETGSLQSDSAVLQSDQAVEAAAVCPTCGASLRPNVRFCTSCGLDVQQITKNSAEPAVAIVDSAEPITKYCNSCGLGVSAATTICPNCGDTDIS